MVQESNLDLFLMEEEENLGCILNQPIEGVGHSALQL